jgi:trehalose-6-phosphate hydrolase
MQWSAEAGAGFTAGVPWIQPAPDYAVVNVAAELAKPDGVRAFYAALIRLRKTYAVIQQGDYTPLFEDVPGVLAYRRHCASASAGERTLYSLHNFFERHTSLAAAALPAGFADGRVLAANYPPRALGGTLELRPYETLTVLV